MDNPRLPEPVVVSAADIVAAVDTIRGWVADKDRDRLLEADVAIAETVRSLRHLADVVTDAIGTVVGRTGRIDTPWGPRWLARKQGANVTDWDTVIAAARRHALFDPETGEARSADAAVNEFARLVTAVAPLTPSNTPRVDGLKLLGLDKASVTERERVGPWKLGD